MSDFLWPHELQYASLLCPSLSPKFSQTHVHWVSGTISPSHSLLCSSLLPSIFPNNSLFQWVDSLPLLTKVVELQLQHQSPSSDLSGLICFRIDSFDSLAVQGTLQSLLQQHNSKAAVLQRSAFFKVQLSHPYMTTGKTIALTIWNLSAKWCLWFLICCLGWSSLSFQGVSVF